MNEQSHPEDFFREFPTVAKVIVGLEELLDMDTIFERYDASEMTLSDVINVDRWFDFDRLLEHGLLPMLHELQRLTKSEWICSQFPSLCKDLSDLYQVAKTLLNMPMGTRSEIASEFSFMVLDTLGRVEAESDLFGSQSLGNWGYYLFYEGMIGKEQDEIERTCRQYGQMHVGPDDRPSHDARAITFDAGRQAVCDSEGEIICTLPDQESRFFSVLWSKHGQYVSHLDLLEALSLREDYNGHGLIQTKYRLVSRLHRHGLSDVACAIRSAKKEHYGLFIAPGQVADGS